MQQEEVEIWAGDTNPPAWLYYCRGDLNPIIPCGAWMTMASSGTLLRVQGPLVNSLDADWISMPTIFAQYLSRCMWPVLFPHCNGYDANLWQTSWILLWASCVDTSAPNVGYAPRRTGEWHLGSCTCWCCKFFHRFSSSFTQSGGVIRCLHLPMLVYVGTLNAEALHVL